MNRSTFLFALFACCVSHHATAKPEHSHLDFALLYFRRKGVTRVTSFLCRETNEIYLARILSDAGIQGNSLRVANAASDVLLRVLKSPYLNLGILVDRKCDGSDVVLRLAHDYDLFIQTKSLTVWLIIMEDYTSEEEMMRRANNYEPETFDHLGFLLEPYPDTPNEDVLLATNRRINAEFILAERKRKKVRPREHPTNATGIDVLLPLNILVDNRVLLLVPASPEEPDTFTLYKMRKITPETRVRIEKAGEVSATEGRLRVTWTARTGRTTLEGAVVRAVTAIYGIRKFTWMGDLRSRHADAWSKMTYSVTDLLKNDMNFSLILRFFDDYGWMKNGSFTALVGHLQQKKAEISGAGLILRLDRLDVIDYIDSPFHLDTGILFREPSLSSVSNIFLLPFDRTVWFSVLGFLLLITVALKCEAAASDRYRWPGGGQPFTEIIFFVLSAVAQQGYPTPPNSYTGRLVFFLLLFASLALFTAFSAKIVSAMQSFGTSILTLKDITHSSFEVGIQKTFPHFDVSLKEGAAAHEVVREFYHKKILGHRGDVHCEPKEGIERIRRGLFAFEVELTVAYKQISDTYDEIEKCGLKEVDLMPKPYLGTALRKHTAYKEIFARRLKWFAEVGLTRRAWKRWIPQKPKCETSRIGFISVGFNESYAAIVLFVAGFSASFFVFFFEILCHRFLLSHTRKRHPKRFS